MFIPGGGKTMIKIYFECKILNKNVKYSYIEKFHFLLVVKLNFYLPF